MNFIFTGIFWSVVLILLGIGIIINVTLKTHIPFFRIFMALLLVYIGLSLLLGRPWQYQRNVRWHGHEHAHEKAVLSGDSGKYDVVFGSSEIDLTKIELKEKSITQEIDIAFGSGRIMIDPQMPIRIEVNSAFADAKLPSGSNVTFGDQTWNSPAYVEGKPHLLIKADVAFGEMEVVGASGHWQSDSTKKELRTPAGDSGNVPPGPDHRKPRPGKADSDTLGKEGEL
jgi:hypothetical protein